MDPDEVVGQLNGDYKANKKLIEALANSDVYRTYSQSFSELTGLVLAIRPYEVWQLPYRGHKLENRFCALMSQWSKTCAGCLQTIHQLSEAAKTEPAVIGCSAGLTEVGIPILLGNKTIGFLQTGQVFRSPPTEGQFEKIVNRLQGCDISLPMEEIREAYFATRVITSRELRAVTRLLKIFADHLAIMSNQILLSQERPEPVVIHKAKKYIQEHYMEELTLSKVAQAVNTSTFYFCKIFKKYTGLNFTEYVSRIRIEKAKTLALNPNLRISDIAYEVGFQSLTHFNRVFKNITGMSPSAYRTKLLMNKSSFGFNFSGSN